MQKTSVWTPVDMFHIGSKHQPADMLTKAVGRQQFQYLRSNLGMIDPHATT